MDYIEALNVIKYKQRLGSVPGLSRVSALLAKMDNPQNRLKIIHIAGTNGKGTVAHSVADAMRKQGYKVGLFTSPWVIDFREQIQINGEYISENDFADLVFTYGDSDTTEFEFITAVAYKYFADNSVDFAVIECGMGGESDATNAIKSSRISVITSVSMDHTDYLGDSLEKIARQKAGIIKENGVCILYPNTKTEAVFEQRCRDMNARPVKVSETGDYLKNDIAVANAVLKELGICAKAEKPDIPARQETVNGFMLDGAHNVGGAIALSKNLPQEKIAAVIGMMKDKDIDGYLSVIAPKCAKIIAVTPNIPRAQNCNALAEIAKKYCSDVIAVKEPLEAIALLRKEKCFRLVCGSFYLAREVRKELLK